MSSAPVENRKPPASSKEETELLSEVVKLLNRIDKASLPPELKENTKESLYRLNRSMRFGSYQAEYEKTARYIERIVSLPWNTRSEDKLDLVEAKKILDKNHYGLTDIKNRILEYLAVLKLRKEKEKSGVIKFSRSPVICLVGLPGTGKTSFAESVAEALGRKFVRIAMGGMSNALILRGQSKAIPEAEMGQVMKNLRRAGTKNPVLLLDEIDSTSEKAESDLMGVLLELLDPEQNFSFTDYYLDYPFDLSEVLFICSANQVGNITRAVADRLEVIIMPRYTDEDKIKIARDYILPKEFENVALEPSIVKFTDDVWPYIIKPFGYDIDVRSLQRTVNAILRKVARAYIEGRVKEVTISKTNLPEYLPSW
ncbi:AAA family ATPase [Patescibacteria group bacterium]|nr:AAA family ATPase [Patescibacteria group bacterium]